MIIKQTGGNTAGVFIDGPIGGPDGITGENFMRELSALDSDCELNIFFNSDGGSVEDGRQIYKAIHAHPGRTTSHIQGLAASIASVIAMACDEVFIAADALVMVHEPHWSVSQSEAMCSVGNQKMITIPRGFNKQMPITIPTMATDKNASVRRTLEDNRRTIKKHRDLLNDRKVLLSNSTEFILDIYHARTGAKREDLRQMMAEETWFTASDAVQFGFADFVTAPTGLVDHVDFTQFANPTNFLAAKYMDSATTARAKRLSKVNRKQVSHMQQRVQKILNNRQQETL